MKTLSLNSFFDKFKEILGNNLRINIFTSEKYGKDAKIFIGANPMKPPEIEEENNDLPLILIAAGEKKEGEDYSYSFGVTCAIKNGSESVSGNITEYHGLQESIEFAQIVYEEIAEGFSNHEVSIISDIEGFEYFPVFIVDAEIKIKLNDCQGCDLAI